VSKDYDVAIVGFGPVGALTALLLAEEGLSVAVLERSTEPVVLPRAVGLDGESVRAFQRIGFGEEVAAILQPARERDEVCFTNSKRERLFGTDIAEHGPSGWRDIAFFDQPELEALLRARVAQTEGIDVSLGAEVDSITQSADGVTLHIAGATPGPGGLRAAYAIGCDGASSFVRRAVGIGWTSLGCRPALRNPPRRSAAARPLRVRRRGRGVEPGPAADRVRTQARAGLSRPPACC